MGTGAQTILNQVDTIGNGALSFGTGLLGTSVGQIVIVAVGILFFALIISIIFFVMRKAKGGN